MKFTKLIGLLTILAFSFPIFAQTGYWAPGIPAKMQEELRIQSQNKKRFAIESSTKYDFNACHQHENPDREYDYFISCINGEIVEDKDFSGLIESTAQIETHIYKENILSDLKESTLAQLNQTKNQLTNIETCITQYEKKNVNESCQELLTSMLSTVREDLPALRKSMAIMKDPVRASFSTSNSIIPKKYSLYPRHKIGNTQVPKLTENEIKSLDQDMQVINFNLDQAWFQSQIRSNKCIEKVSPTVLGFMRENNKIHKCAHYQAPLLARQKKKGLEEVRRSHEENYIKLLNKNPLLAQLSLTGEESDSLILKDIKKSILFSREGISKSIDKVKQSEKEDLQFLIANDKIVENYLKSQGPSQALCDVTQSLKDENDLDEFKTDMLLAGSALIGGGVCALTAGVGCLIGAAITTEAIGLTVAQNRFENASDAFESGLRSASAVDDRQKERNMALLLAPLSVVGEGIGQGVKLGSKALKYSPTGKSVDLDFQGVYEKHQVRTKNPHLHSLRDYKNKKEFIEHFEEYILTSPKLNKRWITNAKSENAAFYVDVENAALKRINDSIGDKSYVTALTNLHKDILSTKINKLLKDNPDVEIEIYSDFKSLRYAFLPKDMPEELKNELIKKTNDIYVEANKDFANMVKTMEGIPEYESPAHWFKGAINESADMAGAIAKKSRELTRTNPHMVTLDEVRKLIDEDIKVINNFTNSLAPHHPLVQKGLTEKIDGTNKSTVKLSVIETIRKLKSPTEKDLTLIKQRVPATDMPTSNLHAASLYKAEQLKEVMSKKFNVQLTDEDSLALYEYSSKLDGLTPGLWVEKREAANLNNAQFGGMSGDITGMGARNIQQVAKDIAKLETDNVEDVIRATRIGEQEVTETFNDIKKTFQKTVGSVLRKRGIGFRDVCSGDDCVVVPTQKLSKEDQSALVTAFKEHDNPSQFRLSFIPDGVKGEDRTNLAVHGELVEKELRKIVTGVDADKIPHDQLVNITMATSMPNAINQGGVQLLIGVGEKANLNSTQKKLLEEKLKEAVKKVNLNLKNEFPDKEFKYNSSGITFI